MCDGRNARAKWGCGVSRSLTSAKSRHPAMTSNMIAHSPPRVWIFFPRPVSVPSPPPSVGRGIAARGPRRPVERVPPSSGVSVASRPSARFCAILRDLAGERPD